MNSSFHRLAEFLRAAPGARSRLIRLVAAILAVHAPIAPAQTALPTIALPGDAHMFDIGSQITLNGLPMRMKGFVSASRPEQVADWFRRQLGKPLVENQLANKLILGRAQGEHYLTIQLEPAGGGTRGLVAVANLKAAYDNQADPREEKEHWLARLPSGSSLISQMSSHDGGRMSKHIVITNTYSEEVNRDRIKELMHEDGLELERETSAAGQKNPARGAMANGRTLYFKGKGKDAIANIFRDESGRIAIVLNISRILEPLK